MERNCQFNQENDSDFEFYKLNGDISLHVMENGKRDTKPLYPQIGEKLNATSLEEIINIWHEQKYNGIEYCSNLSFAWERPAGNFLENLYQGLSETEVFVVVGYSFPFFNREIDQKIIQSMPNLKKVYLHAPNSEELADRFKSLAPKLNVEGQEIIVEQRKDPNQFTIPMEM